MTPVVSGPAAAQSGGERAARLQNARLRGAAARERARQLCLQSARVLADTEAVMEAIGGRPGPGYSAEAWRDVLHRSEFARLVARAETMPVIEQAKGILMAQHRCGPDEAFDLLRRASQCANVRISVLAARMVEQVASPEPQATGEPSTARVRGLPR